MSIKVLREIFQKAVSAVQPHQLIQSEVKVVSGVAREQFECTNIPPCSSQCHLVVRGETFQLPGKCYMVGFGKAVLGMATEMERVLGGRWKGAIVSVPAGIFETYGRVQSQIEFLEGAKNNLPDADAMAAALKIKSLVESMNDEDLLIVLISGGGSALLPLPVPPITLEEKFELIRNLARKGAKINELNCVRKKISLLKGGGLAKLSYPRKTISLILSDIVDDPLDLIASGPTVEDNEPLPKAVEILKKYELYNEAPASIKSVLNANSKENGLANFTHVSNFIIGNNSIAAEASKKEAERHGFHSIVVSTMVEGEVDKIARVYAELAQKILKVMLNPSEKQHLEKYLRETLSGHIKMDTKVMENLMQLASLKQLCLILAGEPTVVVKGKGKGGRNQQLALAFAAECKKLGIDSDQVSFLSCGTDGIDGPTDAAGAIAPGSDIDLESALKYLENNDAYTFFERWKCGENLVKIGHTGTNVMDIHVMIIKA